jgi:hypothetical protein
MKTVILRIKNQVAGPPPGYPIELYCEDGRDDWRTAPLARELIPIDLDGLNPGGGAAGGTAAGSRNFYSIATRAVPAPAQLGERLFDLALRGSLRAPWDDFRDRFKREGAATEGRRVVLEIQPPELRRLPWERMGKGAIRLARDPGNSFVRGLIKSGGDLSERLPLKALVVMGSEDEAIQAKEEVRLLEKALWKLPHRIDYRVVRPARRQIIQQAVREFNPHVFHFIGHGTLTGGTSCLILEIPGEGNVLWRTEDIYSDLAGAPLRFAFLNACHSKGEADQSGIWSIADTFFDLGARAVVGMSDAVRGIAAAELAARLYSALVEGNPLDLAMTAARQAVEVLPDGKPEEWALPYLHLTVEPDKVLPFVRPAVPQAIQGLLESNEFHPSSLFFDRLPFRDVLRDHADGEVTQPRSVVLVDGEKKVGKSTLLCYGLEACLWRGYSVRYHDLRGTRSLDFLALLRRIRDGDDRTPLAPPMPAAAFATFNQELNALLDGKDPRVSEYAAAYPTVDEHRSLVHHDAQLADRIFANFTSALQHAAILERLVKDERRPLILALDHLGDVAGGVDESSFRSFVIPHLISPIARGTIRDVLLVLGACSDDLDDLGITFLNPAPKRVPLTRLKPEEFAELATEYLRRRDLPEDELIEAVNFLKKRPTFRKPWSPAELEEICRLVNI